MNIIVERVLDQKSFNRIKLLAAIFTFVLCLSLQTNVYAEGTDNITEGGETSEWLLNYEYEISDSDIILLRYIGADVEELVVPAKAVCDGKEYDIVIKGMGDASVSFLPQYNSIKVFRVENGVRALSLRDLFVKQSELRIVDLRGLDTSDVEDMSSMFSACTKLRKVYLQGLDVSNVKDMSGLFKSCILLEEVDLSKWDVSSVTGTVGMFDDCYRLGHVKLSSLPFNNCTYVDGMFTNCRSLVYLDLSNMDMSKVTEDTYSGTMLCDKFGHGKVYYGSNLKVLKTPKNVLIDIELPEPMYSTNGEEFTNLPKNQDSITLVRSDAAEDDIAGKTPDDTYSFVERMYTVILGREAEQEGEDYWTDNLFLDGSGSDMVRGFIGSEEFKNKAVSDEEYVRILYRALFNREPDETGYAGWLDSLKNGSGRDQVLEGFLNSDEFCALCLWFNVDPGVNVDSSFITMLNIDSGNVNRDDVVEYVKHIYIAVLGREADEEGLNYWVDTIMNGYDKNGIPYDPASVIANGFFLSEEYQKSRGLDEGSFVADCFHAFFNREPDQNGLIYWQTILENDAGRGIYGREKVIKNGFGHSEEFVNLLKSYGFKVN
ncbi:MAG: DUF4214 domain-containing protein [Lachnospiraceae bacterium]|nr:DUF4214 domain-containing protein [Lachnospiraceae bacterium]